MSKNRNLAEIESYLNRKYVNLSFFIRLMIIEFDYIVSKMLLYQFSCFWDIITVTNFNKEKVIVVGNRDFIFDRDFEYLLSSAL